MMREVVSQDSGQNVLRKGQNVLRQIRNIHSDIGKRSRIAAPPIFQNEHVFPVGQNMLRKGHNWLRQTLPPSYFVLII